MRVLSQVPKTITVSADRKYLTIGQLCTRYGVSPSWIERRLRDDSGFPKPVRLAGPNSIRHWLIRELDAWDKKRGETGNLKHASDVIAKEKAISF